MHASVCGLVCTRDEDASVVCLPNLFLFFLSFSSLGSFAVEQPSARLALKTHIFGPPLPNNTDIIVFFSFGPFPYHRPNHKNKTKVLCCAESSSTIMLFFLSR